MRFHPAGNKIIRNTIILIVALNLIGWLLVQNIVLSIFIFIASLTILILVLQFFRYPGREVTINDKLILSPADGKVCLIEECIEKEYLNTKCLKVSIFMSPLNVHINWVPIPGTITFLKHKEGEFYAAFKDKSADENERYCTAIKLTDNREIMVNQVAGAVARRILNFLQKEQEVTQEMEMGFIRFGSRVDLYLPLDTKLNVKVGDIVTGSQTVIGELS